MALTRRHASQSLLAALAALLFTPFSRIASLRLRAQDQAPRRREFKIAVRNYSFTPDHLEVAQDDVVRLELRGEDQAHGFALDEYRISKRVLPGKEAEFEFRADRPGTFTFYCGLTSDPNCRAMRGTLVVRSR